MSAENNPTVFSLSQVTRGIARKLREVSAITYWVQAEIGDVSDKGGHYYGSLVETKDGAQVAKLAFRVWKKDKERIAAAFKKAELSFELKVGMNVIVECRLEFHAVYGLSLVVTNADPRFILGELEMRKRAIIERILKAGADKKNKQLAVPRLPLRIGLITSRETAAYYDVYRTLEQGGFAYRVSFADATMQGDQAAASIQRGLKLFETLNVDLVVIVRGGGNKTDLATLDNEELALAIAAFGKPVWVAVGHETDSGVLDIVAHTSFKTPTALAEAIVDRFEKAQQELTEAKRRIEREWQHAIVLQRQRIEKDIIGVVQGSRKLADISLSRLSGAMEHLRRAVGERSSIEHRAIARSRERIRAVVTKWASRNSIYLSETARSMQRQAVQLLRQKEISTRELGKRLTPARVQQMLDREQSQLNDRLRHISANDPRKVLERGYTITTSPEGEILKSINAVAAGRNVRIEFHDGRAEATISSLDELATASSQPEGSSST